MYVLDVDLILKILEVLRQSIATFFREGLTPLLAIIATYIAYQQYATKRDTLKLALYDKRFNVYKAVTTFIGQTLSDGTTTLDRIRQFGWDTREGEFLFDKDISGYIEEIARNASNLYLHYKKGQTSTPDAVESMKKESELLEWFAGQLNVVDKKFMEYLGFKRHRLRIF